MNNSSEKQQDFEVYVIFGKYNQTDRLPIWSWKQWEQCYHIFDDIIKTISTTQKGEISSRQLLKIPLKKLDRHTYKRFPLGKLVWTLADNKKWTTLHQTKQIAGEWELAYTEINIPAMHIVAKNNVFPLLHIDITCHATNPDKTIMPFHQSCKIVIEKSIVNQIGKDILLEKIKKIADLMHPILVIKTSSPWSNNGHSLIGGATQFLVTNSTHTMGTCVYGNIIAPIAFPYTFDIIIDNQIY
jgi:hypothetical protein